MKIAPCRIYSLNPRSEKLDLLLTRAVNIQEQKFSAWDDNLMTTRLQFKKDSSPNELVSLVTRMAQAGNTNKLICGIWQPLGEYHYSPFSIDSSFRDFLTDMKLATKYYTLALTVAKTDEQKAKCHFMLAKCERNQWYNETIFNNSKYEYGNMSRQRDFLPWNGFKALQQYPNTQFYKEAIKECGYFRTYTQK